MAKIYLLHNGLNKGEFFSDMRMLAKSLIDYAAIPKEHHWCVMVACRLKYQR